MSADLRALVKRYRQAGWKVSETAGKGGHVAVAESPEGVTVAITRRPSPGGLRRAWADARRHLEVE